MLDAAAHALEEIELEDKSRKEVLEAQINVYVAAKKWYLAAALAVCLVKADPGNPDTWIKLARIVRRAENVEEAEKVLFKARAWHPKNALIAFKLACYASVMGRMEERKYGCYLLSSSIRTFCVWRSLTRTSSPYLLGSALILENHCQTRPAFGCPLSGITWECSVPSLLAITRTIIFCSERTEMKRAGGAFTDDPRLASVYTRLDYEEQWSGGHLFGDRSVAITDCRILAHAGALFSSEEVLSIEG